MGDSFQGLEAAERPPSLRAQLFVPDGSALDHLTEMNRAAIATVQLPIAASRRFRVDESGPVD